MRFIDIFGIAGMHVCLFTDNFKSFSKNTCRIRHFSKTTVKVHVKNWILSNISKISVKKHSLYKNFGISSKLSVYMHKFNRKYIYF